MVTQSNGRTWNKLVAVPGGQAAAEYQESASRPEREVVKKEVCNGK